jgi:hypothetical protein
MQAVHPVGLEKAALLNVVPDQVRPVPHFIGDTREPPEPAITRQIKPVRRQAPRDEMKSRPPAFGHHASEMIDGQPTDDPSRVIAGYSICWIAETRCEPVRFAAVRRQTVLTQAIWSA